MPELPEVETIARKLAPQIIGKKVDQILVFDSKLKNPKYKKLSAHLITKVFRSGKQVVIAFAPKKSAEAEYYLSVHLRMTGRLLWQKKSQQDAREKHVRLRVVCGNQNLDFVDVRRFGTVTLSDTLEKLEQKALDPMSASFTKTQLKELIGKSKQEIKSWLLRQDRLVGIGNIYASEILFEAKVSPFRLACSLNDKELERVAKSTKAVLKKAIKNCGTTFSDFQDSNGEIGNYQNYLKVYQREGESCKRCKNKLIQRAAQQQRSTFYCARCQL